MGCTAACSTWCSCTEKRKDRSDLRWGKEGDPVFTITDNLIHLAGEKMEKTAAKVIEGENMDLLIGNMPLRDCKDLKEEEKELVKANILSILKQEYGIEEDDFSQQNLKLCQPVKQETLVLTAV